MKLFIKIRYIGTAYAGYQVQPGKETVQKKLNEAAEAVFGFPCDIVGCSRTDSGVHAKMFCATISREKTGSLITGIPVERIPLALSAHLPEDISVFFAKWVEDGFHARYDVREKEYLYRFYNHPIRNPFEEDRAYHIPIPLDDAALERMQKAASDFLGRHDFSAFRAAGSKVTDPHRTVTCSEVTREGDLILFRVAADGFLYHMVRIMAGTLLEIGEGKRPVTDIAKLLEKNDRTKAGMTAPACGLYLNRVSY